MGLFISFEGIDKSGKTTQISNINSRLTSLGYTTQVVAEPGTTNIGNAVRKVLKSGIIPENTLAQYLLFSACRAELISKVIRPILHSPVGEPVILSDRYLDSSYVYNGQDIAPSVMKQIDSIATYGFMPDRTYIFDISYEEYKKRLKKNDSDSLEPQTKAEFMELQQRYYNVFQFYPNRCVWINCEGKTQTQVTNEVMDDIYFLMLSKKKVTPQFEESRKQ